MLMMQGLAKPYLSPSKNKLEYFNELCLLLMFYSYIFFTD